MKKTCLAVSHPELIKKLVAFGALATVILGTFVIWGQPLLNDYYERAFGVQVGPKLLKLGR